MDDPTARLAVAAFSAHALAELARRGLSIADARVVLGAPEQWLTLRPGRIVCQSRVSSAGGEYLLRVFVDIDRDPPEVVTVYRTSKIAKYWRPE